MQNKIDSDKMFRSYRDNSQSTELELKNATFQVSRKLICKINYFWYTGNSIPVPFG